MAGVHVIADPIHGLMDFTADQKKLIKPIIDHPCFQRLRHIKQLGLADLVFPGAVHTRFNHSLGVAFLAKRLSESLKLDETPANETIIAALLHDIGHGPFSHAFEDLLKVKNQGDVKANVDHEKWTQHFISRLTQDGAMNGLDSERVCNILCNPGKIDRDQVDIVSSQLDADRLDYLLRDSHFCGVTYGKFDLNWLVRCIQRIPETSVGNRLGIDRKGISAVEQFLMARRLMTKNVYYHHKVKVAEKYLVLFLESLAAECTSRTHDSFDIPLKLYTFLKRSAQLTSGSQSIEAFMQESFEIYATLTDFDIWQAARTLAEKQDQSKCRQIAYRLFNRKLPKCFPIRPECFEGASYIINEHSKCFGELNSWKIGIHKNQLNTYKSEKNPILVREESGSIYSIESSSRFLSAFTDAVETNPFLWIDVDLKNDRNANNVLSQLKAKGYIDSSGDPDAADEAA
jgi:HD superfamily phosphohydrolase